MDIHRCRFIPYPAVPINALAFSHETTAERPAPKTLRLALGRANGDIEIWDPKGGIWVQELILKGGKGRSIEGLAWTHDLENQGPNGKIYAGKLRLFSIGYSNAVTEWDISTGKPVRNSSGNYGEVWCVAAQPRWEEQRDHKSPRTNQVLAVGCSDGSIVLHSTEDGDLIYKRTLQRPSNLKARILSLAFKGRDTLVAGCSDSTIWIYDIRGPGRVRHTMSLGAGPKGGSNSILVWSVKSVGRDTLVSGDSNGEIRIWDLKTATQVQRLKCHDADIHDIAVSSDGSSLLTAGSDRKMCKLQYKKDSLRWSKVSHRRVHHSQVKAMAALEATGLSVVVSGGNDSVPTLTPLRGFGVENHRSLPSFPNVPPVVSAGKERILVSWWDGEVSVCRVTLQLLEYASSERDRDDFQQSVLDKIIVQGEENITSVSVSQDSTRLLAIGTISGCKLFHLGEARQRALELKEAPPRFKIRKLEAQSLSRCGIRLLQFSPDGLWLLTVQPNNKLLLHRIVRRPSSERHIEVLESPIELHRQEHPPLSVRPNEGTLGEYQQSVCRIAWSSDSRVLVCSDLSGNLDVWTLKGLLDLSNVSVEAMANGDASGKLRDDDHGSTTSEDESIAEDSQKVFGQVWSRLHSGLPKLSSFPLVLSFRPSTPALEADKLAAITSTHEIYEFEVLQGHLSSWSRRNPPSHFPKEFMHNKERVIGCIWDTQDTKERLWVYSGTALWMFDLSQDFPTPENGLKRNPEARTSTSGSMKDSAGKKRKRKLDDDEMSWQGPTDAQDTVFPPQSRHSHGAGDKMPLSHSRHSIGGSMKTTTTEDMERTKEPSRVDFEEEGSFGGFSDDDELDTLSIKEVRDVSFTLAEYRREREAHEGIHEQSRTNGGPADYHFAKGLSMDGLAVNGLDADPEHNNIDERERSEESEDADVEQQRQLLENGDLALSQAQMKKPHFWRTYKYRPILGIVPLERVERDDVMAMEDDEILPDLEVALVERPLWETDLDLPWEGRS